MLDYELFPTLVGLNLDRERHPGELQDLLEDSGGDHRVHQRAPTGPRGRCPPKS